MADLGTSTRYTVTSVLPERLGYLEMALREDDSYYQRLRILIMLSHGLFKRALTRIQADSFKILALSELGYLSLKEFDTSGCCCVGWQEQSFIIRRSMFPNNCFRKTRNDRVDEESKEAV